MDQKTGETREKRESWQLRFRSLLAKNSTEAEPVYIYKREGRLDTGLGFHHYLYSPQT